MDSLYQINSLRFYHRFNIFDAKNSVKVLNIWESGNGKNYSKNKFILKLSVAKMDYLGIKDVPQVFVCVDRIINIKNDIHIWHTHFTFKSLEIFHVFVNCLITCYFGCYGLEVTFCCFDYCCTGIFSMSL